MLIADYKFGFYDKHSQNIDDIAWWSRHYLSVWATGNDRGNSGRPYGLPDIYGQVYLSTVTNQYFAQTNRVTTTITSGVSTLVTNMIWVLHTNTLPANDFDVNGGYDLLTHRAVDKNNLVVGAVHKIPGGYGSPLATNVITSTNIVTSTNRIVSSDGVVTTNVVRTTNVVANTNVVMSVDSSWGPTDDGRIKPDIVAAGVDVHSTYIDHSAMTNHVNMGYTNYSGTGMAAPTVAGSLNLLTKLHRRLAGTNTIQPMLASTLRSLAIHTADEAGDHPGPDYRFGWGLFNGLAAANLIINNHHSGTLAHIKEVPLNDRNLVKFPVVARGGEPLKVTVCWTDPAPTNLPLPALDLTNRMLVNDLDLRLVYESDSGNVTNFPWVLNPLNPTNAATRGINRVDNVEQVVIENPPTNGVYNVHVSVPAELTFPASPMGSTSTNLLADDGSIVVGVGECAATGAAAESSLLVEERDQLFGHSLAGGCGRRVSGGLPDQHDDCKMGAGNWRDSSDQNQYGRVVALKKRSKLLQGAPFAVR